MNVELRTLDQIRPYEKNPRKIPDKAVQKVAASIKEFGFQQPIVVDKDGVIIVGHTRLKAAEHLGLSQVPVIIAGKLTSKQVRAYRIADNRLSQETGWFEPDLISELTMLGEEDDYDLSFTGFEVNELTKLFGETLIEAGDQKTGEIEQKFNVVVTCKDDEQQRELIERLTQEGLTVKARS